MGPGQGSALAAKARLVWVDDKDAAPHTSPRLAGQILKLSQVGSSFKKCRCRKVLSSSVNVLLWDWEGSRMGQVTMTQLWG